MFYFVLLEDFTATKLDKIRGIITLTLEAERVSEALGSCPQLTWLVAREDFIYVKFGCLLYKNM
jgi:hypothetical protein